MYFQRIKDLREDNDLSQQEVADLLFMQRSVYGRYERGERETPAWIILKLAEHYKVSADYILGLTKDSASSK